MNDPGEPPNRAAILAAPYGRGTYIYVPLALFRQLPAGVSGGARIFREPPRRQHHQMKLRDALCVTMLLALRCLGCCELGQTHRAHRVLAARQGAARVPREGIREGASRHRRAVGRHGIAGSSRARARGEAESAGGCLVRRAGGSIRPGDEGRTAAAVQADVGGGDRSRGRDANDNWYGTYLTPEVIAYNSAGGDRRGRAEGLGRSSRSEVEGEDPHSRSDRVGDDARDFRRDHGALDCADGQTGCRL